MYTKPSFPILKLRFFLENCNIVYLVRLKNILLLNTQKLVNS
jgi:hypothetical protein